MASADWFQSLSHFLSCCGNLQWLLGESKCSSGHVQCSWRKTLAPMKVFTCYIHRKYLTEQINRKWAHLFLQVPKLGGNWKLRANLKIRNKQEWNGTSEEAKNKTSTFNFHILFSYLYVMSACFVTELLAPPANVSRPDTHCLQAYDKTGQTNALPPARVLSGTPRDEEPTAALRNLKL